MAGLQNLTNDTKINIEEEEGNSSIHETEGEQEDANQMTISIATEKVTNNREEYLQSYKDLLNESKFLHIRNNILHRRLAEYYRKRKLEHVLKPYQGTSDLESKIQQKLLAYEELKEKAEKEKADIWSVVTAVEKHFTERYAYAAKKFVSLQSLERTTGAGLIYSKKGRPMSDKTLSRLITLQAQKYEQASELSLKYIRARNAVAELEAVMKNLETLRPGLYVYQYEQLNVDNTNFKIKIEEREDELIKNRSKSTEHNQILAHIREKMQHTDQLIDIAECDLGEAEIGYSQTREYLGDAKTKRNRLRWLLEAEKHKAGLLARKDLLRDFDYATEQVVILRKKKESLEAEITKTAQQLREARRHINL